MKTLVAAFITALLVFALATVWSESVQPRLDLLSGVSAKSKTSKPNRTSKRSESQDDSSDEVDSRSSRNESGENGRSSRTAKGKTLFPSRLEQIKHEEAKLADRQDTIQLLYNDISRELDSLKEIRRQSAIELAMAEKRALDSSFRRAVTVSTTEGASNRGRKANPKDVTVRRFAVLVQGLVDLDNQRAAAALLGGLEDREASKVLSLLRDSRTAARLADQIRTASADTTDLFEETRRR